MRFDSTEYSLYATNPEFKREMQRNFHNSSEDLEVFHKELDDFDFKEKELIRP